MMKPLLFTIFVMAMSLDLWAQEKEPVYHWAAGFTGGLGDNWDVELAASYRPVPYVGVGGGFAVMGALATDDEFMGTTSDGVAQYSVDNTTRVAALRGELQFTTPGIKIPRQEGCSLALRLSPGVSLALPVNNNVHATFVPNAPGVYDDHDQKHFNNHGGDAWYFPLKAQAVFNIDRFEIMAGYMFSNLDIYGGARNVSIYGKKLNLPKKSNENMVTLGVACKF